MIFHQDQRYPRHRRRYNHFPIPSVQTEEIDQNKANRHEKNNDNDLTELQANVKGKKLGDDTFISTKNASQIV